MLMERSAQVFPFHRRSLEPFPIVSVPVPVIEGKSVAHFHNGVFSQGDIQVGAQHIARRPVGGQICPAFPIL